MSLLNRSTKLAGPMGAIALTSASATLFGRQTTQNATSKVSAHATRHMHVFVQNHLAQVRREACKQHKYFFSTSSNSANGGFVKWYEGHLSSSPVATKAVTGSILWGLGDLVAQLVPTLIQEEQTNSDDEQQLKPFQYDYPRTARAVFFGFALHAPLSHLHFNFLEWMTVRTGFTGLGASVFKTVMEQFVYWSWLSNSLYHGAMGAMQGKSLQQIYNRISDVLMDTQIAQWKFWIPVQLLNFRFVPVRHQLNVVLLTSVVWTALLSAWYPPEEEESNAADEGKEKSE